MVRVRRILLIRKRGEDKVKREENNDMLPLIRLNQGGVGLEDMGKQAKITSRSKIES